MATVYSSLIGPKWRCPTKSWFHPHAFTGLKFGTRGKRLLRIVAAFSRLQMASAFGISYNYYVCKFAGPSEMVESWPPIVS